MRVLTFTNLYPSSVRPHHGLFIEHRVRRVAALDDVELKVVAPVPWFPLRAKMFGDYAMHAAVPAREERHGIEVFHPRYVVLPKIGMRLGPGSMVRGTRRTLQRIRDDGFDFDVIDAHYLYPDGVAAVELGEKLERPVVLTARGSDVNLIPQVSAYAKRRILDATRRCAAIVTVSEALRDALVVLGAPAEKIRVIHNGVDRELFRPPEDGVKRADLPTLLSVGSLVPNKGHQLVIEALQQFPDARLVIAGRGPMHDELEAAAKSLGVSDRVEFAGSVDQERLSELYGRADVLVLASASEGLPNVVLEAMACGTPVVATRVGGIPEAVREPGGVLIQERTAAAVAAAVRVVLTAAPDRELVRATIDEFDWNRCAAAVRAMFAEL